MATTDKDTGKEQGTRGGQQESQGIGSPVSNEAFNIISALHKKLEGLEAFRKYAKDGDAEVWRELTQADVKCVERLVDELETMVRDNRFRLGQPGKAGPKH